MPFLFLIISRARARRNRGATAASRSATARDRAVRRFLHYVGRDGDNCAARTLLSPAEVAARLGSSTATVRRHIRAGSFPAYRLGPPGSAVRLDWREVQEWLPNGGTRRLRVEPAPVDAATN